MKDGTLWVGLKVWKNLPLDATRLYRSDDIHCTKGTVTVVIRLLAFFFHSLKKNVLADTSAKNKQLNSLKLPKMSIRNLLPMIPESHPKFSKTEVHQNAYLLLEACLTSTGDAQADERLQLL